jgi:hypothetical protein
MSDRDDQAQGDQCHVGLTDITIENKKTSPRWWNATNRR